MSYFSSILSEDEGERANRFRFPKDQRRFIVARGILRCLLAEYLEQDPRSIDIVYGLWGKPCLAEEKALHFNLSHSNDYAMYAVTLNYEVGIDIEYIDKKLKIEDIALNIFSASELNYWNNFNSEDKVNSFFKFWVCKEAFLKALGKGWLENEKESTFTETFFIKEGTRNDSFKDEKPYPYCFESIPGYASAFFIKGPSLFPLHFTLDKSSLKIR